MLRDELKYLQKEWIAENDIKAKELKEEQHTGSKIGKNKYS